MNHVTRAGTAYNLHVEAGLQYCLYFPKQNFYHQNYVSNLRFINLSSFFGVAMRFLAWLMHSYEPGQSGIPVRLDRDHMNRGILYSF